MIKKFIGLFGVYPDVSYMNIQPVDPLPVPPQTVASIPTPDSAIVVLPVPDTAAVSTPVSTGSLVSALDRNGNSVPVPDNFTDSTVFASCIEDVHLAMDHCSDLDADHHSTILSSFEISSINSLGTPAARAMGLDFTFLESPSSASIESPCSTDSQSEVDVIDVHPVHHAIPAALDFWDQSAADNSVLDTSERSQELLPDLMPASPANLPVVPAEQIPDLQFPVPSFVAHPIPNDPPAQRRFGDSIPIILGNDD